MKNMIDYSIFKSYDIRGTYPQQINESNLYQIIQAIYAFYANHLKKDKLTITIAHDMRLSYPKLYPILIQALQDTGSDIIDIGLVSTPSYYFAVLHNQADCGIILSASHNPPQYSGLKMVVRENDKLIKVRKGWGMDEIINFVKNNYSIKKPASQITKITDTIDQEINHAFKLVDPNTFKPKEYKVVADTANAMGITYLKPLFDKIPSSLTVINPTLDGSFPAHQPDPLVAKNLIPCQQEVIRLKADIGLCPDGDGDRMIFIDEKGSLVPPSIITSIVAKQLLKTNPNATIVVDIRYLLNAKKIIEEAGGKSIIVRVGHSHITQNLNDNHAIFAGESSGHYFFSHTGGTESQVPVILFVLKAMFESNMTLSQLTSSLTRCFESGEYNFVTDIAGAILDRLKQKYSDGKLSTIDGISIDYPTWRFNVRTSNTEPLMRLNLESYDQTEMKAKLEEIKNYILEQGAKLHHD